MAEMTPAVVCVSAAGLATAERAASALGGALHGRAGRVAAPVTFAETAAHLAELFLSGRPIVAVAAAGVVIRALAPHLSDKRSEPPVLAVSADGASVTPLLGGHRGANVLARRLAEALDGHAALTTASDARLGLALDAPPPGWRLANPEDAPAALAEAAAGAAIRVRGEADWLAPLRDDSGARFESATEGAVTVTVGEAPPLHFLEQRLALGVGCARFAPAVDLEALLDESGAPRAAIAAVFTLDLKADEAAANALARRLGVPLRLFDAATLERQTPRLANPSEVVFAEVGCHGVSEAAALAGAGAAGRLIVPKLKSAHCTLAVAEAPTAILDPPGRKRGRLGVVGIGPGQAAWRTPEATRLVAEAEELVGYSLYLDLLGPLAAGKTRSDFGLGDEEARCRHALERAGTGVDVALICSGDAGIYAMGALVMELMDRDPARGGVSDAARRVEVVNAPGVSALQAASARAGALLGHDFCTISLSDLLTPWETIERRIRAAATGDFVIALYNPVSKRRRTQLAEAKRLLLEHRPAKAPVLLASDLGRPDERLRRRTLATLEVDEVDMLTVVLVGSSQSRAFQTGDAGAGAEGWRLYTPRGYAKKMDGGEG